jgi:hypothetical protein
MGIINSAAKQSAVPPKAATPPVAAPAAQGGDLQNNVHRVVAAAAKVIYNPQVSSQIAQIVKAGPTPAEGIAHAATFVLQQLVGLSKGTMPPNARAPALKELTVLVAEIAQHAGALKGDMSQAIIGARQLIVASMTQTHGVQPHPQAQPANVQSFMQR